MKSEFFKKGKGYLIRTVTMIYTGEFIRFDGDHIIIKNAAWIPETERWADSVKDGKFSEVEPYPDDSEVAVNRQACLDIVQVDWKLPREQK